MKSIMIIYYVTAFLLLHEFSTIVCGQDCPDLPPPTNGGVTYDMAVGTNGRRPVGTEATLNCDIAGGYYFVFNSGNARRTCQSNGQWSGSSASCGVPCPVFTMITGRTVSYSFNAAPPEFPGTRSTGLTSTITCDSGYTLVGSSTGTCWSNGTWSNGETTCQAITCPALSAVENRRIVYSSDTTEPYDYGTTATYQCDSGYELTGGDTVRTCTGDGSNLVGQWGGTSPDCIAVDCGPLLNPQNGHVELTSGSTIFNSIAVYSCDVCSDIMGVSTRVCSINGYWEPAAPSCQVVNCNHPPMLRNGMLVGVVPNTECNSSAIYNCSRSYELVGKDTRICQPNGMWSDESQICRLIDCGPLSNPPNGLVDTSAGTTFEKVVTYSCDPGYNLTGCAAAECLSSGSWSCSTPFCTDNTMIQLKFGPTSHCVVWSDWKVQLMYKIMHSSILKAIQRGGHVIPKENIQEGYFSCYRSTTETTYRTTITGTEGVSAADYAQLIQEWVESGVTTRVQWYVIKIDKTCPVSIMSMDEEECV